MDVANFKKEVLCQFFSLRLPEQAENESGSIGQIVGNAGRTVMNAPLERKHQLKLYLEIKNLVIHDKRETTACAEEREIMVSFHGHPTCDDRGFLKQIVKKCGCLPFSEKMNYRKFQDVQKMDLPFCDVHHYYDCAVDGGPIEIAADDCLPSCVTIRNQYTLSTTVLPCGEDEDCSALFYIKSPDHSYVVFEDRFQLTTPQFVSQLGGDIGLYTGLSLLSIWQLIVFLHNRYKRYAQNTALGKRGFLIELFRDTAAQFDRANGNDLEVSVRNDTVKMAGKNEKETELEKRVETMENQFARMVEEFAIVIAQLEAIKREMGDLKRRKNK